MIHLLAAFASSGFSAIISLVSATASSSDTTGPAWSSTAAIRFNTDGTYEKGETTDQGAIVWTNIGDWITPTSAADSTYEVGYTNKVGSSGFTSQASVEDAYAALSAQRVYTWNDTSSGADSFTADFRIKDGSGTVLDTKTMTFDIDNSP